VSERARFEAWMRSVPGRKVDLSRCGNQGPYEYIGDATECAWRAWQAALATPPAGVCVAEGVYFADTRMVQCVDSFGDAYVVSLEYIDNPDDMRPLDGHKLRVWVEDLGGA